MSQIKKKFIANNAIDGSKIQLQPDQALRARDQNGDSRDLFYFSQANEFKFSVMPKILEMPQAADDAVRKAYVDQEVASVAGSLQAETSSRLAGDSALQSNIDIEKARIDAILAASSADKDSFAEIVALINSVDTENDTAFAGYVSSNNAALAQEASARAAADTAEASARAAADTALQNNINAKTLDSLANVAITSKADGHVLEWDTDSSKWVNVLPLNVATVASTPVTTENLISSQTVFSSTIDFQSTYGTTYRPVQDITFSKIGFKLGRTSLYQDDYRVRAEIYEVDADFYANGAVLASNYLSRMTLVATSVDVVLGSALVMKPAVPGMVYFNFNNIQLSASKYYVIWARALLSGGTDLSIGTSTKYLWGSGDYGKAYGTFQNHLKSVQGSSVSGSTESSIVYELYAMVTASNTSAVTGLIKTNSSGLLDQSFLAYDVDFGSHKLKGVSTPSASTDAANKGYVDGQIAAEASARAAADTAEASARAAADTAEASARAAADSNLQTQINNILSNTDPAALDSLTEIVAAFQAADSSLNNAISALGTGSSSALAQEISDRISADNSLDARLDVIEGADTVAGSIAKTLKDAKDYADQQKYAEETRALAAESALQNSINAEQSARQAASLVFARFSSALTSTDIANGYVEFDQIVKHESVNASVDRLALRYSLDYTLSNVDGKTRLVFTLEFLSGAESPAAGDLIHGNYTYANEDQPNSGG
jgi:hypothetical protein